LASTTDSGTATRLLLHQTGAGQFVHAAADGAGNLLTSAGYQGAIAITPGIATTPGRAIGFICTAAGSFTLTLADGSTITLPITTTAGAFQVLPFSVSSLALGTGTAGTFWNLK